MYILRIYIVCFIANNTAADIDECGRGMDNCSQGCSNTIGSYECYCNDGFTLDRDLHTCNGMLE